MNSEGGEEEGGHRAGSGPCCQTPLYRIIGSSLFESERVSGCVRVNELVLVLLVTHVTGVTAGVNHVSPLATHQTHVTLITVQLMSSVRTLTPSLLPGRDVRRPDTPLLAVCDVTRADNLSTGHKQGMLGNERHCMCV